MTKIEDKLNFVYTSILIERNKLVKYNTKRQNTRQEKKQKGTSEFLIQNNRPKQQMNKNPNSSFTLCREDSQNKNVS